MKSAAKDLPQSIEESHEQLIDAWETVTELTKKSNDMLYAAADAQESNMKLESENQILRDQNAALVKRLLKYEPVSVVTD